MSSMIDIRDATLADVDQIRDLLVRTWHATYDGFMGADVVTEITGRWHSREALSRNIGGPAFLVAFEFGRCVGTSLATQTGDVVQLHRLYVLPDAQSSGVGSALLRTTLDRFPDASAVRLEVDPRNADAQAFYQRNGFIPQSQTTRCGGEEGMPAIVMEKRLQGRLLLRPVLDKDAQELFGLLSLCFSEYPGCYVDPHDDLADLVRPASAFAGRSGAFTVVEDRKGRICACIAVDVPDSGVAELHRLYVRPDMRKNGLGRILVEKMEAIAKAAGAPCMMLYSDTRFVDAHRLYERLGYQREGEPRDLGDISNSREFFFRKTFA